ncbi:hypothetical protein PR202_gb25099 [Eleusine coracana subsp. coracana]|uniref:Uncharacterized protein n=1 Tax=Eleusine coracana subsp. coracana TaxID=191504 RepID=A0AAV5FPQ8_ELECO|nr:hypothetical protein PR202_gb25099 [Eleusine coracana subsp. coracana]
MFVEIVEMCLATKGAMRPSMDDVVRGLECALQLQDVNLVTSIPTHPPVALGVGNLDIISEATTEVGAPNDPHGDLLDIPWNQIFCQTITEAEGR